jgi:hypothetical protein
VAERREDLRAADADRAHVADRLRIALEEGRLTLAEYDERLQQTYAAKTYGELDPVLGDLPGPASAGRSQVAPAAAHGPIPGPQPSDHCDASAARGSSIPKWLRVVWSAWLSVVLVNVVIWVMVCLGAGELVYFWPIWVAGPWGAVLLALTISGLGRGAHRGADAHEAPWSHGHGWAARAERYAARDARRQARRAARYR